MINRQLLTTWILHDPPLVRRQKLTVSVAAVSSVLSTMVCAWMGGAGGQTFFNTKHEAAYWPFFMMSPILILLLCGRAMYRRSKVLSEPSNSKFEILLKPKPTVPVRLSKLFGFLVLLVIAGSINAYNTVEYLPFWFAIICVIPALGVPGFAMVPALVEYHRRVWFLFNYLCRGQVWRRMQAQKPESVLTASYRQYRQLDPIKRQKVNAVFSHPSRGNDDRLQSLFRPLHKMPDEAVFFDKPRVAYLLGILGFVIGTLAELYSYQFGRKMTTFLPEFLSILFGVVLAYVRMGISAVATSDVFADIYDDSYHSIRSGRRNMSGIQIFVRVSIGILAITSSLPNVQNQIKTMGREDAFGHVLSICAIIAPACLYFWAGDLVFRDWQYKTPGISYHACFDKLFSCISSLKKPYYDELASVASEASPVFQ